MHACAFAPRSMRFGLLQQEVLPKTEFQLAFGSLRCTCVQTELDSSMLLNFCSRSESVDLTLLESEHLTSVSRR